MAEAKLLAEEIVKALDSKRAGEELHHREGERESGWVLLDFSTVVVHIFLPEQREFYKLDRLWQDGETVDISGLLEDAREQRKKELEENRF